MTGHHKFSDLIEQLPPERREAVAKRTAELLAAMPAPLADQEMQQAQAQVESGHQEYPGGRIVRQGPRATRESIERWERQQANRARPTEGYL